jgi:serine/threonine protein phosphatase PrpC
VSAPAAFGTDPALEVAVVSDVGTERPENEDSFGHEVFGDASAVVAVADGISGNAGGEVASRTAIEALLRSYREQPAGTRLGKRLYRAALQANIDVYDLAIVVTELRGMGTTLTALAIDRGELAVVHVGDSRLYLLRGGSITQLTKDHTVTGDKVRLGLMSEARARHHPDRSTLTRSIGRELIVAFDRFTRRVFPGDALIVCSDGLYNVLDDAEIAGLVKGQDVTTSCGALIAAANERGTMDNLTVAVVRMTGPTPAAGLSAAGGGPAKPGLLTWLRRLGRRPEA